MTTHSETGPGRWLVYTPPLLLLALVLFAMLLFDRAEATSLEVHRIERTRLLTVRTLADLQDAETGQRGYLLTGDESYLAPYVAGRDSVSSRLMELGRLTRSEPLQQAYLKRLEPIVQRRLLLLDTAIVKRRSGRLDEAVAVVASGRGKQLMDSARTLFALIRREEGRMFAQGEEREAKDRKRLQIALVIGVVLSAIASFLVANKLANDATRHWLMSAELHARLDMMRAQAGRASGEGRRTPTSNKSVN